MKRSRIFAALALALVCGCERMDLKKFEAERSAVHYRAAMADYMAGRLKESVIGFEKVVREDPLNASARFQLAMLYGDVRKDHLGAICQFREYLNLAPGSDKAGVAKERLELSERLLAPELARKMKIIDSGELAKRNAALNEDNAKLRKLNASVGKANQSLTNKVAALTAENERLRRMLSRFGDNLEVALQDESGISDKDLLEEDGGAASGLDPEGAKRILAGENEDATTPFVPRRTVAKKEEKPVEKPEEPKLEKPDFYVVEEGDTLYEIARRFYGRVSAWKTIREANKAIISTDGRVRAGQKLELP